MTAQRRQAATTPRLLVPYGGETLPLDVEAPCRVLEPNHVEARPPREILEKALSAPFGVESLSEFLSASPRVLVVVNDASRPTPTAAVLDEIGPELARHPDVTFVIATGAHRAPTDDEYEFIFGSHYATWKDRIVVHDARRDEDMTYLGRSTNGTEMYVNRIVSEIGNVVTIGSVEPHYFAGFTGGRKSLLPGVASYRTIEMNHRLAMDARARAATLEGNPVNEDMVDAMRVLGGLRVFSIQTVLTGDHRLYAATAGDLHESFDAAIQHARDVFCVPIDEKADLVVTVAPYPMDIDLYQSQKALDNGKLALRDGGIMILVSKCRSGIGDAAFLELLGQADGPQEVMELIAGDYKLGYHKAAKIAEIATWAEIWALTGIDDDTIRTALMRPVDDLQAAVDEALAALRGRGREPNVTVLPAGSLTVPLLSDGRSG